MIVSPNLDKKNHTHNHINMCKKKWQPKLPLNLKSNINPVYVNNPRLYQPVFKCLGDRLTFTVYMKLFINLLDMAAHRINGNEHF